MPQRFRRPWSVRELERAFVVEDANGQAVAYTYFRHDPNEARQANVLTHDEARRIAANRLSRVIEGGAALVGATGKNFPLLLAVSLTNQGNSPFKFD